MKYFYLYVFFLVFLSTTLFSQNDNDSNYVDIFDLTFEQLLDLQVNVVSRQNVSLKNAPAILSVITQKDILNSGARDLIDVLNLVPGFSFNIDVQSVKGVAFRGNWANEGKVLLMIDGQEINEDQYSTLQFGNHIAVDQIQKIEIIRGPGSSTYGGYAELSVINIVTKNADDISGINLTANYGQLRNNFGHRNFNLSSAKKINDFSFSLHAFYSQANCSDIDYTDFWNNTYDLTKNNAAKQDAINSNLHLNYKNLSAILIYDNYMLNSVDMFDELVTPPQQVDFQSVLSELKYEMEIKDKFKIVPKINLKSQKSWFSLDDFIYTDRNTNKIMASLLASYDINSNINVILGAEGTYLNAVIADTTLEDNYTIGDGKQISFYNNALYSQLLIKSTFANISVGGRVDMHQLYDAAFSPRIGLTKSFNNLYFKFLFNGAYRAPAVENINFAPSNNIIPEKTYVGEAQLGYNFSNFGFALNLFDININNTIVYFYDEVNNEEGYKNVGKTGTRGLEFEFKYKSSSWGQILTNYSFYNSAEKNEIPDYATLSEGALLANPQHKITLTSNFNIFNDFVISPSFIFLSQREAYTGVDDDDNLILSTIKPTYLFNINLLYKNLFIDGLNLSISAHDILNQRFFFYQPYDGYHAPYPGKGREISLKISYSIDF